MAATPLFRPRARGASRLAATILLVSGSVVATGAVAGCSPITNEDASVVSNGVRASVGPAVVTDLVLVADAAGEQARVVGAVTTDATEPVDVSLTIPADGGASTDVTVTAGQPIFFAGEGADPVVVDVDGARPGSTLAVTITAAGDSTTLDVPVLGAEIPEYATLVPSS